MIDEVDGLVTVKTFADPDGWALGWAQVKGARRYELRFNVARLNGSRRIDRDAVTLHELGHVIDFALLDDGVRDRLAAQVPKTGVCHARARGLRGAGGALRRHVRQVGAARCGVDHRRGLQPARARVARGLGRAAVGARDRARRRVVVVAPARAHHAPTRSSRPPAPRGRGAARGRAARARTSRRGRGPARRRRAGAARPTTPACW